VVNKTVALVCIAAVAITLLGLVGWVQYLGGDVERILGWSGTTIGPLLGSFAAILATRNVHRVAETVRIQTNGTMKDMGERIEQLEKGENT
jgi:hypothetical protein